MKNFCIYCDDFTENSVYIKIFYNQLVLYQCKNCGLIFGDPNFNNYIDYSQYDYYFNNSNIYNYLFNKVKSSITKYTSYSKDSKFTFLDIGCGEGFIINKMKSMYPNSEIMGIDSSINMCKKAYEKFKLKIIQGYFGNVSLSNKKFNIVTMLGNLMLHENPILTLKNIYKILPENGILIFDIKNPSCSIRFLIRHLFSTGFLSKFKIIKLLHKYAFHGIRYGFTKNFIKKILEELNFKILSIQTSPSRNFTSNDKLNSYSKGFKSIFFKLFDFIDQLFNQKAWIDIVCKKK